MIGQLKHRARVEIMHKIDNGRGGWTEIPEEAGEMWVAHYRVTERTRVEFKKAGIEVELKFFCRYREDLEKGVRLTVNGKKYKITSLTEAPIDPNDYMELYCVGEK